MNTPLAACNYALLRFLPYPDSGEFVNVGVLVVCQQPCLFRFMVEDKMTARLKAVFPDVRDDVFEAGTAAIHQEMERVKGVIRDPKSCQREFNEAVRPRETAFRFSDPQITLTADPKHLDEELFRRYVRRETRSRLKAPLTEV